MNKKTKIIGIITLSIVTIILTIGLTYSFFVATGKSKKENEFASNCFNIELDVEEIENKGAVPIKDEDAHLVTPTIITIKNTCKLSAEVGLNLDVLNTTVGDLSHFKLSLSGDIDLNPTTIEALETTTSLYSDTLVTKKLTNIYVRGYGEKKIELRTWFADTIQNGEGFDHELHTKLSLSADAILDELSPVAEKIIADNGGIFKIRNKEEVDLTVSSPGMIYGYNIRELTTKAQVLAKKEFWYSSEYEQNGGGKFVLVNPIKGIVTSDVVGKFTCGTNADTSCSSLMKIKEVEVSDANEDYSQSEPEEKSINGTSTLAGNRTVAKGFHLDQDTGKFVLDDITKKVSFTDKYIGYYACGSSATALAGINTTSCSYIHEILEVKTDPGEGKYYSKETLNSTVSFTSKNDKMVASLYAFDNQTGNYTLLEPTNSVSYGSDYIDYYTCNTNESTCTTLYKIKEVTDTTLTKADKLVKTTRMNRLKKVNTYSVIKNYSYLGARDVYDINEEIVEYDYRNAGLFMTEDNLGDTYYFRGENEFNNLFFGGFYWNIVRINGDGTLRLIYRGLTPDAMGEDTSIGISKFNTDSGNAYLGYMFGIDHSKSYIDVQQNINDSIIKLYLEDWYEKKLLSNQNYIADTYFCNDRSIYSGTGVDYSTAYKSYKRISFSNNLIPTLKCEQKNDVFTISNNDGNKKNKYPIGLITGDELSYGGLVYSKNNSKNYLNTGINYWTMSPGYISGSLGGWSSSSGFMSMLASSSYGITSLSFRKLSSDKKLVDNEGYVRPVINLKGNAVLSGKGTIEDPYIVEGLNEEVK